MNKLHVIITLALGVSAAFVWHLFVAHEPGDLDAVAPPEMHRRKPDSDNNGKLSSVTASHYEVMPDGSAAPDSTYREVVPKVFVSARDKRLIVCPFDDSAVEGGYAMLELRFCKPGNDAKLAPQPVMEVFMRGVWREDTLDDDPDRAPSLHNTEFHLPLYSIESAYAYRCPIASRESVRNPSFFRGLYSGQTYLLHFKHEGYENSFDTPEKQGWSFVKVPSSIAPGETIIIEVDVTKKFEKWWLTRKPQHQEVRISLDDELATRVGWVTLHGALPCDYDTMPVPENNHITLRVQRRGSVTIRVGPTPQCTKGNA